MTKEEFVAELKKSGKLPEDFDMAAVKPPSKEEGVGPLKEAHEAFNALDKDGCGFVTKKEFMSSWKVPKIFVGFDFFGNAGDDAKLSWPEFVGALVEHGRISKEAAQDILKETVSEKDTEVMKGQLLEVEAIFNEIAGDDDKVSLVEFFKKTNSSAFLK